MDASTAACWFSDPGMMEDPSFHQWELGSLDQFANAQNLWDNIQQPFTSSFNAAVSGSSMESYSPKKIPQKTSRSSTSPSILSFGNPDSPIDDQELGLDVQCASAGSKRSYDGRVKRDVTDRPPSHNQDHVLAERKRREKLSQRFISLSAIIPGLKKMDKNSVLGGAIKYLKQLQEQVKTLEEQSAKKMVESAVIVKKCQLSDDDGSSLEEIFCEGKPNEANNSIDVEVEAKLSGKTVLLKIHCKKSKGLLVKILAEIESLKLSVLNSSCIPFTGSALDITVMAQVEEGFSLTVKELVKKLNVSFKRLM
ncbi:uncharacterized protein A4U43_C03F23760 [Asparagus officinalis]|uniref:BHLH domain-containing protein n=1 Tax=Asparagus officinalis TaxID=4686 RepID=A0A5P1FGS5_ASPOF|nr:transcription factor bHLH18-like [Asparagus officinalis]ONK76089.1 uncharacterized protein A4U43_C03F23760 [Asparagus officinalis]